MPPERGGLASRRGPTVLLERWHTYWGWLFYGLLVAATGLAAADVDSGDRRVAIVVLAGWKKYCCPGGRKCLHLRCSASGCSKTSGPSAGATGCGDYRLQPALWGNSRPNPARDLRGMEESRRSSAPRKTTKDADLQVSYGSDGTRTRDLRRDRPSRAQRPLATNSSERAHLQALFAALPPRLRIDEPIVPSTFGPRVGHETLSLETTHGWMRRCGCFSVRWGRAIRISRTRRPTVRRDADSDPDRGNAPRGLAGGPRCVGRRAPQRSGVEVSDVVDAFRELPAVRGALVAVVVHGVVQLRPTVAPVYE